MQKLKKWNLEHPCPTIITYYVDKSFAMDIKTPPASSFSQKMANLKSASKMPGKEIIGSVSTAQSKEIAQAKMKDLNANDIEAAMKIILGSARSMGLEVKGELIMSGKRYKEAKEITK